MSNTRSSPIIIPLPGHWFGPQESIEGEPAEKLCYFLYYNIQTESKAKIHNRTSYQRQKIRNYSARYRTCMERSSLQSPLRKGSTIEAVVRTRSDHDTDKFCCQSYPCRCLIIGDSLKESGISIPDAESVVFPDLKKRKKNCSKETWMVAKDILIILWIKF